MPRLRARRREAQPRQPFFCVCPAGVESCPAEVQVEVEAAFRLSRATWLALGGWYDLTLTTPGLAWPRLAWPGPGWFSWKSYVGPSVRDIQQGPYHHGTGCLQETLLASLGFSCSIVVPAEVASESWDKTGKGRLVELRAHFGKSIDLTADGILRPKWHTCRQYRVNYGQVQYSTDRTWVGLLVRY